MKTTTGKEWICVLIIMATAQAVFSQAVQIRVTDEKNKPLESAYVTSKSTGRHWHSNPLGEYDLQGISFPDTLMISHIGYSQVLVPVDGKSSGVMQVKLSEKKFDLGEVLIKGNIKSLNVVTEVDLNVTPVNSAQEMLRNVPGLIIGQHAGGGKAEQIFLRGFDCDHGTDIDITVDGIPVNMVSHAHSQGYADLHFLIPEIIGNVDFGKGPYYANKGNFATSGYAEFETIDKLSQNSVGMEYGMFGVKRTTTLVEIMDREQQNAYFAGEYMMSDGAFESPQNMNRMNLFGKYNVTMNQYDRLTLSGSLLSSKWNASGQIPQRAVDDGTIGRFGAIDDTEGGSTGRSNLNLLYHKYINANASFRNRSYFSAYHFDLFSNFTFFLNDSVNGDQIRQKEDRRIFGTENELTRHFQSGNNEYDLRGGIGFRMDDIRNIELSHAAERKFLEYFMLGDIAETNWFAYVKSDMDFGKLLIHPALRFDYFRFGYINHLDSVYSEKTLDRATVSPKLNFMYTISPNAQIYLKNGMGFHSNDSRIVMTEDAGNPLPVACGSDLGLIVKPFSRLMVNAAVWYLYLEDELVYVGDEGVVEASGETQRLGGDLGIRWQIADHIFLNTDLTYSYARALNEPTGNDYIPLAPVVTNTVGLFFSEFHGLSGGVKYRYISDRPANEDYSITAKGYFITDASLSYSFKSFKLGLIVENLFNQDWNETQFATETRLLNETESTEEIHFIPGTPFFVKTVLTITF